MVYLVNENIHCIWYCIDSKCHDLEDFENHFISTFKKIPVIIVITKFVDNHESNELMRTIEFKKMNIKYIVPVYAKKNGNHDPFGREYYKIIISRNSREYSKRKH